MHIRNVYAGVMTADIRKSLEWYKSLFGRSSDRHPMEGLHEWDFKDGGVLQLVQDKERAGRSSVTLMVDDIGEILEHLSREKIKTEQQTSSEIAKTITVLDPEKNRITFAENVQP